MGSSASKAQSQPDYLQAFALLESVKRLGHDLERAFDGSDVPAAQAVAPVFLEKCRAYDASVHGTEFESPKAFIGIILKVVNALRAGDFGRAKVEFNEIQKGQFSGTINYDRLKKLAQEIDAAEVQRIIGNSAGTTSLASEETATPKAPSPKTTAFGPVIERVLPDVEEKTGYEALDLRTGNSLSLPQHQPESGEWFLPWLETNRVDFIAAWDPDPEDRNKIYLSCIKIRLSDFDIERWTNATPEECLAALKSGTTLQSLDEDSMDEDFTKAGGTVYLLPPEIQLPRTLAFRTREGISGLLQITGFTENPRGVKIRYKLVQSPAQQTDKPPVTPKSPATKTNAFGPVIERTMLGVNEHRTNCFLDLDTGKIFDAPSALDLKNRKAVLQLGQRNRRQSHCQHGSGGSRFFRLPSDRSKSSQRRLGLS